MAPDPTTSQVTGDLFLLGDQYLSMLDRRVPLADLLAGGARLVGEDLPEEALLELQGAALFVARHWVELDW